MSATKLPFELQATSPGTRARACRFETLHGEVLTPHFMPVGTQGTVRSQTADSLVQSGSRILLANTYHLWIRPGLDVFRRFGGLHSLMTWEAPILTDSGGFQTFSLGNAREMNEEGVSFTSHIDGVKRLLTPEISIEAQRTIGSDIMMVLDHCVASTCSFEVAKEAMDLTHRWAKRCLKAAEGTPQALFGIIQGAAFEPLRRESVEFLSSLPFDGFAIGGLAVGETRDLREQITEATTALMPANRPRYLMGVGTPLDLLQAVHRGVDMFDCILPIALAQNGIGFTTEGKIDLRRARYEMDEGPIDAMCSCSTCRRYSRAYLRHLSRCKEFLGWQLIGYHNLCFFHDLMAKMRAAIIEKHFLEFYMSSKERLGLVDNENPSPPPAKVNRRKRTERGNYSLVVHPSGTAIRHFSGETIHSVSGGEIEARRLYAEPSRFPALAKKGAKEIVLWDVGLGAAFNAMAAIRAYEAIEGERRPLVILSFENDLDCLRLAMENIGQFPHLHHEAPASLLKDQVWNGNQIRWHLIEGNFFTTMLEAPAPELIYFDPFSYKTDSLLWTYRCFKQIYACCRRQESQLFTYSASTAVRAGLLAAGFFVGKGVASGPKEDTTWAATRLELFTDRSLLLDETWLARWERSGAKYPADIDPAQQERHARLILSHPQFRRAKLDSRNMKKLTSNQPVNFSEADYPQG